MAHLDEPEQQGYRWETDYERTWEVLEEDAMGSLSASVEDVVRSIRRKRMLEKLPNLRLGMMRHLFLIIDLSESMKDQDMKPNRLYCTLKLAEYFVNEFFDQNPIGQLGIITTKNKRAERVTELTGNPKRHIAALQALRASTPAGEPSLQNALELASQTLRNIPSHASREIIAVFGSMSSCDPGNILDTVRVLRECNIRVSIAGLAAEVFVCKTIARETVGDYCVALDESHLKDVLLSHVAPPPVSSNSDSFLIRMGFPLQKNQEHLDETSFCTCHLDQPEPVYGKPGYFCPVCLSKYCELPVECKVCGLTLVSAPHLARSYHHLFPVEIFEEVPAAEVALLPSRSCYGCFQDQSGENKRLFRCKSCKKAFCLECDLFIHDVLHSCPGCADTPAKTVDA